jgi:hypothetical protein
VTVELIPRGREFSAPAALEVDWWMDWLRNRIRLLRGRLELISRKEGPVVRAWLPLKPVLAHSRRPVGVSARGIIVP